jgi:hypothetical protein
MKKDLKFESGHQQSFSTATVRATADGGSLIPTNLFYGVRHSGKE